MFHKLSLLIIAMLLATAAQAQVSFNLDAVTLYKSHGIDQNGANKNFEPAIQGSVNYAFENGIYVGNWSSTGNFGNAKFEHDIYVGYNGKVDLIKGFSYDIGYVSYLYPGQASYNSDEVYAGLKYGPFSTKAHRSVNTTDQKTYITVGYSFELTNKLSVNTELGFRNAQAGKFNDYLLSLTYGLGDKTKLSFNLSGATGQDDAADRSRDARITMGIAKSF